MRIDVYNRQLVRSIRVIKADVCRIDSGYPVYFIIMNIESYSTADITGSVCTFAYAGIILTKKVRT